LDDPGTPSELRERLINKITLVLNSGSDEECAICLDSLRQPVITYCAHVYCRPCICEVTRSENQHLRGFRKTLSGYCLFLSHRSSSKSAY
uniref:RING-type domain-containing protein n=1 Tax=Sinocyclocheilus rhinocerous TaxID=307959 RepID=A0A673MNE7_9TELE